MVSGEVADEVGEAVEGVGGDDGETSAEVVGGVGDDGGMGAAGEEVDVVVVVAEPGAFGEGEAEVVEEPLAGGALVDAWGEDFGPDGLAVDGGGGPDDGVGGEGGAEVLVEG